MQDSDYLDGCFTKDVIAVPEPLRDMSREEIKNMDDDEFRTRLLYDLEGMFGYMKWHMWVMGGLNSFLMAIIIMFLGYLARGAIL